MDDDDDLDPQKVEVLRRMKLLELRLAARMTRLEVQSVIDHDQVVRRLAILERRLGVRRNE